MEIDVDTIARAHEYVVKEIIENGEQQDIETHPGKFEKTWEYHDPITIIVRTPQKPPMTSEACMFGEKSMAKYSEDFTRLTPPRADGMDAVYTYARRLFDYPLRAYFDSDHFNGYKYVGNGEMDIFGKRRGVDQIAQIIDRLSKNKESRRANAITWVPEIDGISNEPPCMQFTHFMIRNCRYVWERLDSKNLIEPRNARAFLRSHDLERVNAENEKCDGYLHARFPFRSHDMLSGYGANAVGLTSLMQYVSEQLGKKTGWDIRLGSLTTFSSNAHLYWVRDDREMSKFKKRLDIS
jgi:thymidylate synthase